MDLQILWFCVIGLLWAGYFVLEGFDFGVGMLLPVLGRDEEDRDEMLSTIEPVWDGNEVWLLVAAGATFAAFPQWYATLFSGYYLALLLVLLLLILRVVSFEWRHKAEHSRWKGTWTALNAAASYGAPALWGVALSSQLYGVPIGSDMDFAGSFWDIFSWYSILAGAAVVVLFASHGATFLALRTTGELHERAAALAGRLAVAAAVAGVAFAVATLIVGTQQNDKDVFPAVVVVAATVVAALAIPLAVRSGHDVRAFSATAATIGLSIASLFTLLYPRVLVSSSDFANSLTIENAASGDYTLKVMTVALAVLLPVVLIYQIWTYHVFRARIAGRPAGSPVDLLGPKTEA